MKLKNIALLLLSVVTFTVSAQAQKDKEIIKTGYNFGPLPAVAFDADKGFQLGALLNIYDFGDGSTYPNTRQQWYFEASFFTKGSQLFVVSYDNKFSLRETGGGVPSRREEKNFSSISPSQPPCPSLFFSHISKGAISPDCSVSSKAG